MRGLAQFIMKGRLYGILFVVATSLVPLFVWFGNAALALWTLRRGPADGFIIIGGALAGYLLVEVVATGNVAGALLMALVLWLPVLGAALVLRGTVSLPLTVLVVTGFSVLVLGFWYLLVGSGEMAWAALLGVDVGELSEEQLAELASLGRYLPIGVGLSVWVNTMIGLMLGRYWQALLYNPGGFQAEFHQFRLGNGLALATVVCLMGGLLFGSWGMGQLGILLGAGYVLQGLAVLHAFTLARSWGWPVPAIGYITLPFSWPAFLLVGLVDSWRDLRKSLPKPDTDGTE